jgi:hypothetical protein
MLCKENAGSLESGANQQETDQSESCAGFVLSCLFAMFRPTLLLGIALVLILALSASPAYGHGNCTALGVYVSKVRNRRARFVVFSTSKCPTRLSKPPRCGIEFP